MQDLLVLKNIFFIKKPTNFLDLFILNFYILLFLKSQHSKSFKLQKEPLLKV